MILRGQIRHYRPAVNRPGMSVQRLIVSTDAINAAPDLPVVLALHVVSDDPGGLLTVAVPDGDWVSAMSVEPVLRSRLGDVAATVKPEVMDRVDMALRAALQL